MALAAAALFGAFALLWLVSLGLRDASIVDPCWGPAFVLVAGVTAVQGPGGPRALLALALVTTWGLRLGVYLAWRARGQGEDFRYRAMREKHGPRFWWVSGLTVFALQATLCLVIALPVQLAILRSGPLGLLDALGAALFAAGLAIEAIADAQLARFKARRTDPEAILDTGVWAWSRHPNYFGELSFWWGIFLFGYAASPADWTWTILGTAAITFMFFFISVPMMEKRQLEKKPHFAGVIASTSMLIPWFHRADAAPSPTE
ncbi:MAG: DUF1295 domain-containing protein [Myxococcales bacterium]|nr:DUF1295 domain-containing protein [Myxococcales bacterium]